MDTNISAQVNDCWNQIGVDGDRSCVELEKVIHCRNCPVYSRAGRSLLEREPPDDYLNEWTAVLAAPVAQPSEVAPPVGFKIKRAEDTFGALVFRLIDECFALPVRVLQEVTHPSAIHTLPHRSNDLLLGLVSIRGEILLCACLSHLLGLETPTNPPSSHIYENRMLVVRHKDSNWVFPVDEVYRIHRFHLDELKAAPVVIALANETYTQGIIDWQNKKVNYLNPELLFDALERKILW